MKKGLKLVDVDMALAFFTGCEQIYFKLVDIFVENQKNLIPLLENKLSDDLSEAHRLVHSCKGNAKNLGSDLFFEVSRKLELAILNRDKEDIKVCFSQFKEIFLLVYEELRKIIEANNRF
mgnify:CR=1 FL=1